MSYIIYRKLEVGECERINEINPSQYVGKAWREVEGKRQLVEVNSKIAIGRMVKIII